MIFRTTKFAKMFFVKKYPKKYKPFSENELAKMFCTVVQGKFVVNSVDECHNSKFENHFNYPGQLQNTKSAHITDRPTKNQALASTGCK